MIVNIKMDYGMGMLDKLINMEIFCIKNIQMVNRLDIGNDLFVYFIVFVFNLTVFIIFYY